MPDPVHTARQRVDRMFHPMKKSNTAKSLAKQKQLNQLRQNHRLETLTTKRNAISDKQQIQDTKTKFERQERELQVDIEQLIDEERELERERNQELYEQELEMELEMSFDGMNLEENEESDHSDGEK